MALQNRVNPEGILCFSPARGTLMGNRGCLHDNNKQIVSNSRRDAWVTCLLSFQGRRRSIMEPGAYTELFFLDEATALAAGHRPCATCQRDRYDAFMLAWSEGNRRGVKALAGEVDKQMKTDRIPSARAQLASLGDLPNGTMIRHRQQGGYYLLWLNNLYPWSFDGYGTPMLSTSLRGPFSLITPKCTVNALNAGYAPICHFSVSCPRGPS